MLLVKGSERPASMLAGMCEQWGMQTTLAHNLGEVESVLKGAEHIDVVLVDHELDNAATTDDSTTGQPSQPRRRMSGNDPTEPDEQSSAPSDASASSSANTARPTGLDVAQLVRRSFPVGMSPAVLMLCALSQRQRSMRTVVDAFLSVPVKPSKLFAALVAAQRPKLSHVIMAAGSTSPVLNAASLPPLAPVVGWPAIDGMPPAMSKQSSMAGASSAEQTGSAASHDSQSNSMQSVLYMQGQQQQSANGKRKRDSGPESNTVSPPAGFFSIGSTTVPSGASPSGTPSFPSSAAASPTSSLLTRHPKPSRLSGSALSSSLWSPPATSTSPILGEDSRQFFAKHPMRILAAEDNLINQKVLARMLDRLGYPTELVTIVPNGRLAWDGVAAEAMKEERSTEADKESRGSDSDEDVSALGRRLRREPYHLVFMDIYMPVMDGLDATTSIRADTRISASAQPYVVALTANAMAGDKQKCLESGMEFFLSKPITLGPLMQALRTGYATMCKKRKQLLARQQREDGHRHGRQEEAGEGGGAAGRKGSGSSASGGGASEGRTAGAELRRRGVEQTIISPSVRPTKLAQLGSAGSTTFVAGLSHHSTTSFASPAASPSSANARLSSPSATSNTSPSSAPSHGVTARSPPHPSSELPTLAFARISSAPLSVLTGRMLATSQQLQLLANFGHAPASPLLNKDGQRAISGDGSSSSGSGGGGQRESALMTTTSSKVLTSSVPTG